MSVLSAALRRAKEEQNVVYRDPMANMTKATASQREAWRFLMAKEGHGPIVWMIGAKGSGKTHLGACLAVHKAQKYVGSVGMVISNTYAQAKSNAGSMLIRVCRQLGIPARFYSTKTIDGRPFDQVFVLSLDGRRTEESTRLSYVLVRSFDSVEKIEGIEVDYMWAEEVQAATEDAVRVAITRVRGKGADNTMYFAAMADDETHFQYRMAAEMGAVEWDRVEDIHAVRGILFEPTLFENRENLPPNYIEDLQRTLDPKRAEQWIYGRRTAYAGNRAAYNYDPLTHTLGKPSKWLAYDPHVDVIVACDFNVRPCCASVWQIKPWSDTWLAWERDEEGWYSETGDRRTALDDPDRDVLMLVHEVEAWEGGTRGMATQLARWLHEREHRSRVFVIGDASGNRDDTRSNTTDWDIVEDVLREHFDTVIQRGCVVRYDKGRVRFSNPPVKDSINVLNERLHDAQGRAWVFFKPSTLESGGVAASVAQMTLTHDGRIDDRNDRRDDRAAVRSHFFDTVRYAVWYFNERIGRSGFNPREVVFRTGEAFGRPSGGGWAAVW